MSDDKKVKGKGKKNRKVLSPEEKAAKAAKYNQPNENFRTINNSEIGKGKDAIKVTTQACHVRGMGTLVREITSTGSVSTVFIPGVKIKKKKEWNTLVEDKGPKVKKGKKAEK